MLNFNLSNKKIDKDSIKINLGSKKIKLSATLYKFRDKDTRQIIYYLPCLELSGYGSTDKKAIELLNFSVNELFQHFTHSSQTSVTKELRDLGWKLVAHSKKEFSKSFVDCDGHLKNFNAVADQVEQLTVQI